VTLAAGRAKRSISFFARQRSELLILAGPSTPVASSERVLDRHVVEVAVLVLARFLDELAGKEVL
jgi:hypothetical protein